MSTPNPPRRRHSPAVYRRRRLVVLLGLIAVIAAIVVLIMQPWRSAGTDGASSGSNTAASADAASTGDEAGAASDADAESASADAKTANDAKSAKSEANGAQDAEDSASDAESASDGDDDASSAPTTTPDPAPGEDDPEPAECAPEDLIVEADTDHDAYDPDQKPRFSIVLKNIGAEDCTMDVGTATQSFVVSSGSDTYWRSTDCQTNSASQIVLLEAGKTVSSAEPVEWDRTRSATDTCKADDRPKAGAGGASYHLDVSIGGVESISSAQFILR